MNSLRVQPLISVIIPTYNRAALLPDAIDSVLDQDYPRVEAIVVDDGSTDETPEVLSHYPQVIHFRQSNSGQGAARQTGLQRAQGAFVATLDSDDIWNRNFLSSSLAALQESGSGFVFSSWATQDANGSILSHGSLDQLTYLTREPTTQLRDWRILSAESTRRIFTRHCPAPSSSLLVDRRWIKRGWLAGFRVADDWAFLLDSILSQPTPSAYRPVPLWRKRLDGSNICDRHADPIRLAEKETHDLALIIQRFGAQLSPGEVDYLERRLSGGFRDLAHFQSRARGTRRAAVRSAIRAWRHHRSAESALILIKSLCRCCLGARP